MYFGTHLLNHFSLLIFKYQHNGLAFTVKHCFKRVLRNVNVDNNFRMQII